ncbi:Shedu anti-phage system protein SduA domain-containing protein [Streptomyces tubercidicus]|uniref:Shedu anti-phage system protein SduA domain-containing protein n=1 Tax=Streptomyces tubercidicus TaxID=47759 RepID=UPI0013583855|nr:Shedu anti-phage system protein SduA domain-containing protein [Streptomyces tubercidicus]WAU15070.1 DUF4263 domain-containing protein [Streptomyces tubercidicus]
MDVRSDASLELQLRSIRDETEHPEVGAAVLAVLDHIVSAPSGRRKGGKALVALLGDARRQAAEANEWHVVRMLQDSVDYAEGRIQRPDFDMQYHLFQRRIPDETYRKFVADALVNRFRFVSEMGRKYLSDHPEADAEAVLSYIDSLELDARFINPPTDRSGRYLLLRGSAEYFVWMERVLRDRIDIADPEEAATRIVTSPDALALLAADADGQTLLRAAELRRRAAGLDVLRTVAEDRSATEADLQRALEGQHWIFGGRYIGEAARRRLTPGDEVDIPLIRGDGALHVVELKRSMSLGGPLLKRYRNAWVPTAAVHDAVAQAVNYLVGLDENHQRIREEFGIESRRASAVVLIGHPALQPEVPEHEVNEALRVFNTHINRIEVLTYKDLLGNAERSLGEP